MNTVSERLHKWSLQELNFVPEGFNKIPDVEALKRLTKGKNQRIWNYVINHVRSESTVDKVKRTLYFKQLLKEREENTSFNEVTADISKLQIAVSKATKKMVFLKRTLSTIEERILNVEQIIGKLNDETFQINQKAAFFELLKQKYAEKNVSLKILQSQISSSIDVLHAYQSTPKLCNQIDFSQPYGYFSDLKFNSGTDSIVRDMIKTISSVITIKCSQENEIDETLLENIEKYDSELKKRGFLLTDLLVFLKGMSDTDMQNFATSNLCSVPVKNFGIGDEQRHQARQLLTDMKYDTVSYSLSIKRKQKRLDELHYMKTQVLKDRIASLKNDVNDIDFETKHTLLEVLAENEALLLSNNYLEENIQNISSRGETLKQSYNDKFQNESSILVQTFCKNADLAFHLLYTTTEAFQKILNNLNNLQSFAQNDFFGSQTFLSDEHLIEIKGSFTTEKKLMWDYCESTNLFKLLPSEPCKIDYPLSVEVRKPLLIQPFENVMVICENWNLFKQALRADAVVHSYTYEFNNTISTSEMYEKIIKMMDKMKIAIEQGMLLVNDGMSYCNENKVVLQDWWEQNAQFIPHIEYEGKTLKMWLDILNVLSDFEPANYSS